jgi:hypothetical protein
MDKNKSTRVINPLLDHIKMVTTRTVGRDSSVGIATCYRLDCPGIESWMRGENFLARPQLPWGLTQPLAQWATGFLSWE